MKNKGQISFLDEIIVDNFAGGGGASTGIELATGRVVDIAVNHDAAAILMHKTNHPHTEHYQANVWDIDPRKVCRGRPVGLAWFSPDCKHFSKAKGGKPVDKNIRGLAWIALRWAGTIRPRVIILENVEEFVTWGPIRRGHPIKSQTGKTFDRFVSQLRALGYEVDWRELVAADYGVPTIRKRFYLIARCDGRPIVWPQRTHAPADSAEVKTGKLHPWVGAAEIIDWNRPCPSIFDGKEQIKAEYGLTAQRPLRPNTLRRIARGLEKFVLTADKPFLVTIGYGEHKGQRPRVQDIEKPINTVVSSGKQYLAEPVMAPWTVTNTSNSTGSPVDGSLHTVTTGGGGNQMLLTPALIQYHTEQFERVRGQALEQPLQTVDTSNRYGLMAPVLTKYYGAGTGQTVDGPLHTVTARDREGLAVAYMQVYHDGGYHGKGNSPDTMPVNTVTAAGGQALNVAHIVKLKGKDLGQGAEDPLQTVTAVPCFGVVKTTVCKAGPDAELYHWPQVRQLLNEFCGYTLAEDEILLLQIDGAAYFIADIGLRMLTPRELYRANGFPADYIIDRDYLGNPYPKNEQVARAGNAVCPPVATAIVRANLPEWCDLPAFDSMADFGREVAAG